MILYISYFYTIFITAIMLYQNYMIRILYDKNIIKYVNAIIRV